MVCFIVCAVMFLMASLLIWRIKSLLKGMIYLNISFILWLFLCYLTHLYNICTSKSSLIARVYYYFQILKKRRCNQRSERGSRGNYLAPSLLTFWYHNYLSILLFLNPKGKWSLMFQDGDKDAIEKLGKRTVKVISSFSSQ